MKHFIHTLLLLFLLTACKQETAIEQAISRQMASHPASTLQDLYKNFFQEQFGPGHLVPDTASATRYLRYELQSMKEESEALYEAIGIEGRFVRVNLDVIKRGYIDFNTFLDAFLRSATCFELPAIEDWKIRWKEIEDTIIKMGLDKTLPRFESDSQAIEALLNQGEYVMHHSPEYSEAYQPHYRLIERNIFEKEILPKLP
ncbi:MAG: hypothetical protein J6A40_05395 [Bacteroides sp.]|nr:hypothetical protein [Bacteroides sp.]